MTQPRIAIFISGSGSNMEVLVKAIQNGDINATAALIISDNKVASGIEKAQKLGIQTLVVKPSYFSTKMQYEQALTKVLEDAEITVICLAGFMRILSKDFTNHWSGQILNIHPSLLPLFKGLNTYQRALDSGMTIAGCTVHRVDESMDGGTILGQAVVPVLKSDTTEILAKRILRMEHLLYPMVLENFIDGNMENVTLMDQ